MPKKIVIAIGAHPDDIEFYMAGTLLMLKKAGYEAHYLNLASGNCGSTEYNGATTRSIRHTEARAAAKVLGAEFHAGITDDLEIVYSLELLRALAAIIRDVKPNVVLTHSPQDYMEDHTNTCRLAVTAAFARGMSNFKTVPSRPPGDYDVTVYHAMPHSLMDGLRRRITPGQFVNTGPVHKIKHDALAAHKSQRAWLDASQGLDSFLLTMEDMSLKLGHMSKTFKHAEGWRRHLHFGFCSADADPIKNDLEKNCLINEAYERELEK